MFYKKKAKIENIQGMLNVKDISLTQKHDIYLKLFKEYEKFIPDSAIYYISKNEEIINQLGNKVYIINEKYTGMDLKSIPL